MASLARTVDHVSAEDAKALDNLPPEVSMFVVYNVDVCR